MSDVNMVGVFLNPKDVEKVLEEKLDWIELEEDQVLFVENVLKNDVPIGSPVMIGIDAVECEDDSDELLLTINSSANKLVVKTTSLNDEIDISFSRTKPITGTFGRMVDGELDILTNEEKEFKQGVEELLGDRDDEYSNLFRSLSVKKIGSRELTLLKKIKKEIKKEDILSQSKITPIQLTAVFVEITERYINSCEELKELIQKKDRLNEAFEELKNEKNNKQKKRVEKGLETVGKKIETANGTINYTLSLIEAVVLPALNK